jgi:hypothetical protein
MSRKNDRKSITLQRSSEAIFKRPYEDMEELQLGSVGKNKGSSVSRNYYSLSDEAMRDIVKVQFFFIYVKVFLPHYLYGNI